MSYFGKTGYREGGTRGGQDRFKWDDVKQDKYRENYLGHSVKAPVGRWQKNKDLFWYDSRGGNSQQEQRQKELEEIKQRDMDLINEKLGLAPRRHLVVETQLDAAEVKQLLAKGTAERDRLDVERVEGLGAAPAPRHEHIERKSVVEREIERMKKAQEEGKSFAYDDQGAKEHAEEEEEGEEGGHGLAMTMEVWDAKKRKKEAKKAKKRLKKEKKKEKKRLRKEQEEAAAGASKAEGGKTGSRHDSPSSSSSSSPERGKRRRRLSRTPSPPPRPAAAAAKRDEEEERGGRSDSRERRGRRASRSRSRDHRRRRRESERGRGPGQGVAAGQGAETGQGRGRGRGAQEGGDTTVTTRGSRVTRVLKLWCKHLSLVMGS